MSWGNQQHCQNKLTTEEKEIENTSTKEGLIDR